MLFDLDSVVAGLEAIVTSCAFHAAKAQWPAAIVGGSASVFAPTMARLLSCADAPEDAPLLIRLLSDEGIVGARSTAGREGPVVGRAVRRGGSRPLLVAEVQEHW